MDALKRFRSGLLRDFEEEYNILAQRMQSLEECTELLDALTQENNSLRAELDEARKTGHVSPYSSQSDIGTVKLEIKSAANVVESLDPRVQQKSELIRLIESQNHEYQKLQQAHHVLLGKLRRSNAIIQRLSAHLYDISLKNGSEYMDQAATEVSTTRTANISYFRHLSQSPQRSNPDNTHPTALPQHIRRSSSVDSPSPSALQYQSFRSCWDNPLCNDIINSPTGNMDSRKSVDHCSTRISNSPARPSQKLGLVDHITEQKDSDLPFSRQRGRPELLPKHCTKRRRLDQHPAQRARRSHTESPMVSSDQMCLYQDSLPVEQSAAFNESMDLDVVGVPIFAPDRWCRLKSQNLGMFLSPSEFGPTASHNDESNTGGNTQCLTTYETPIPAAASLNMKKSKKLMRHPYSSKAAREPGTTVVPLVPQISRTQSVKQYVNCEKRIDEDAANVGHPDNQAVLDAAAKCSVAKLHASQSCEQDQVHSGQGGTNNIGQGVVPERQWQANQTLRANGLYESNLKNSVLGNSRHSLEPGRDPISLYRRLAQGSDYREEPVKDRLSDSHDGDFPKEVCMVDSHLAADVAKHHSRSLEQRGKQHSIQGEWALSRNNAHNCVREEGQNLPNLIFEVQPARTSKKNSSLLARAVSPPGYWRTDMPSTQRNSIGD
ncbi:MAG: hypothetical protein LQ340_006732 [Diploschistes diacapsis]|nr:MAG: hypothetical protein LQ340_006732 [Diploschistes diacapsis]